MMNAEACTIEAMVARLDNDFNISNSDYIPRVAAWCIDAMNEMKVLQYETKETTVKVYNRIAEFPCCMNAFSIYADGCEIQNAKNSNSCCSRSKTYEFKQDENMNRDRRSRRVVESYLNNDSDRNYVYLSNSNSVELNFDTDEITIKYLSIKTTYSENYHCDVPVIPNNGRLIAALEWYCMWKLLSRGYKHPVYSLQGQLPVNPYLLWKEARDSAKASVIIDNQGDIYKGWSSMFFNATFRPRS